MQRPVVQPRDPPTATVRVPGAEPSLGAFLLARGPLLRTETAVCLPRPATG